MMNAETKADASPRKGYIPGIDGIRALAIGLVIFCHSVVYDTFTSLRPFGLAAGHVGVTVFFVLSGYLITLILLREEEQTGGVSLKRFYVRRSLRLFPALWAYLIVIGLIWLTGALPHMPWHSFATSFLYIRNIVGRGHETDHLWSLSIEEQFYVIWPLIFIAMKGRNRVRLGLALVVIAMITVWRQYASWHGLASNIAYYMRSDFRFDSPLYGCALALAVRVAHESGVWLNSSAIRSNWLALVGISILLGWILFRRDEFPYPGIETSLVDVGGILLLLSQSGVQGAGSRWLTWKPLVMIGRVSYGLYLWQQLFLGPEIPGFKTIRLFPLGILATVAVAMVSYFGLEQPILRFKERRFDKTNKMPSDHIELSHKGSGKTF